MPGFFESISIENPVGLVVFLVLWIALYKLSHILVMLWRREPLIGWAVGPFGIKLMALREPSLLSIWLDVLFPACVSCGVLFIAFFTSISPITFPNNPLVKFFVIVCGVLITSIADLRNALQDLRYPLWGEARVLRMMQALHMTWTRIHFTPFGQTYLRKHFGTNPAEILQILSF